MDYNQSVDAIHRTYPSKDAGTCQAAIAYLKNELTKSSTTGTWKSAVTDCLAEYTSALNAGTSSSGAAVLSGGNVALGAGGTLFGSSPGSVGGFISGSSSVGSLLTTLTQNPLVLVGLVVAVIVLYKKKKGGYRF